MRELVGLGGVARAACQHKVGQQPPWQQGPRHDRRVGHVASHRVRVVGLAHFNKPASADGSYHALKPAAVCRWIFDLLGAAPGDTLDDLFPGSGAVARAWAAFNGQLEPSSPAAGDVLL